MAQLRSTALVEDINCAVNKLITLWAPIILWLLSFLRKRVSGYFFIFLASEVGSCEGNLLLCRNLLALHRSLSLFRLLLKICVYWWSSILCNPLAGPGASEASYSSPSQSHSRSHLPVSDAINRLVLCLPMLPQSPRHLVFSKPIKAFCQRARLCNGNRCSALVPGLVRSFQTMSEGRNRDNIAGHLCQTLTLRNTAEDFEVSWLWYLL